jgi:hypothetical protein
MRISNIRVPHLGQDGQAMTWAENLISAIFAPPALLGLSLPEILVGRAATDTLTFRWLPLNDIVHRIQTASEMGFNRRKLEDQRRETAEKEAANRRATDAQVLEDAERLIAVWNERQAKRMPMLFSPTIGAAIAAQYWFLWIRCPACRTINAIDLRTLDRHPDAAVSSLIPVLSCRSCRPNAPFAELVRLSRTSIADEMREEHRRRVLGE